MSPDRLDVHVRKGSADRLHISSVGSCQGLWALIMDSCAGYTAQARPLLHTPASYRAIKPCFTSSSQ